MELAEKRVLWGAIVFILIVAVLPALYWWFFMRAPDIASSMLSRPQEVHTQAQDARVQLLQTQGAPDANTSAAQTDRVKVLNQVQTQSAQGTSAQTSQDDRAKLLESLTK